MGRLIDADDLIKELHHMIVSDADFEEDYAYMGIDDCIRSMPTAYDVDAVVAELEKAESVKNFGSVNSRNLLIPLNDAIDIVKAGGVK